MCAFDNKHGLRVRTRCWLARATRSPCNSWMATLGRTSLQSTTHLVNRVLQMSVVSFRLVFTATSQFRTRRYGTVRASHYTRFADRRTVSRPSIIEHIDRQSNGYLRGMVVSVDIADVGPGEIAGARSSMSTSRGLGSISTLPLRHPKPNWIVSSLACLQRARTSSWPCP